MPQVEIKVDQATVEVTFHITGQPGPACERIAAEIAEELGVPTRVENTPEHRLRPQTQVRPQVRQGSGDRR